MSGQMLYYSRTGQQMTSDEWMALLAGSSDGLEAYRRVGLTDVGPCRVSTVWLGINYSFSDKAPPMIFETMVFGDEEWADDQWRYSTEAEAEAGHARVVEMVRESQASQGADGAV